jgi:uncharacterized protein YgiM (DUF1202 family)
MNGRVKADLLNVRAGPSSSGEIVGTLSRNALIKIVGQTKEWLEIEYHGRPAFVYGDFVERTDSPKCIRARVKPYSLNVRAQPSKKARIIGTLSQDNLVEITAESGDWFEIKFNNSPAFIHSGYVELFEVLQPAKGTVNAPFLNVRQQPGMEGTKIGSLSRGAEVEIVSQIGKWLQVKFGESTAYVHGDYVDLIGEESEVRFFCQRSQLREMKLEPNSKLPVTGSGEEALVARSWNGFGNLIQHLSNSIGIDIGCALAVLCVESGGKGFSPDKRLVVRFENHQFWKWWGKQNSDEFKKHFHFSQEEVWKEHRFCKLGDDNWIHFHGDQAKEWEVLHFARSKDDTAALKSISMGAPQIMGFNHKMIGYETVQHMFDNFSRDVRYHLLGLFDFFDNNMIRALRNYDFARFARYYNGPGQAQTYGGWIQDHYEAFEKLKA